MVGSEKAVNKKLPFYHDLPLFEELDEALSFPYSASGVAFLAKGVP